MRSLAGLTPYGSSAMWCATLTAVRFAGNCPADEHFRRVSPFVAWAGVERARSVAIREFLRKFCRANSRGRGHRLAGFVVSLFPRFNDVGIPRPPRGEKRGDVLRRMDFHCRIGGRSSRRNHTYALGSWMLFGPTGSAVDVARGVAEMFRASEVLPASREQARLKYLFP